MSVIKSDSTSFDARAYRDALGCFATGVCLISTRDENGRARALTANSFTSVSLYPPMILWCIDVSSERYDLFSGTDYFAVNMLRTGEMDVSQDFAKNVEATISEDQLVVGSQNIPRYANALGYIECRTAWRQRAGDHVVIFGHVIGYGSQPGDALGFFKGGYTPVQSSKG